MSNFKFLLICMIALCAATCHLDKLPEPTCTNPPVASFTPNIVECEVPCLVTFLNASSNAVSYHWQFGDGDSSTVEKPEHTYTSPGNYTVRLIAIGIENCRDTISKTIVITSAGTPIADFTSDITECQVGCTVQYTNKSLNTTNFTWDFGDGSPLLVNPANLNPTHQYDCSGRFQVILTATGSGITVRDTQLIWIKSDQFIYISDGLGLQDQIQKVLPTPDGGFIAVGYSEKLNSNGIFTSKDAIILKLDATGNEIWRKQYGTANVEDYFEDAAVLPDGNIIAVGAYNDENWLVKLSPIGDTVWQKFPTYSYKIYAISEVVNETFFITGYVSGFGGQWATISIYNTNGNLMWDKKYNFGLMTVFPFAVSYNNDGGCIITGSYRTNGNAQEDEDILVARFNDQGEDIWHTTFVSAGFDRGTAVKQTADGGFVIGAIGNRNDGGIRGDFYLLKLNQLGQKEWAFPYPQANIPLNTAWLEDIAQTQDGGYLLSGYINDYNSDDKPAILLKTDKNGIQQWQKTLSGTGGWNFLSSMRYVPKDCGYIFGGAHGDGWDNMDFMIIKTDGDGNIQ
jgi:PKD repeat protein